MRKVCIFVSILSFCIICVSLIFGFYGVSASAEEGVTPRATPTDLTGYTVTVPVDWSSFNNGIFNITTSEFPAYDYVAIGYAYSPNLNQLNPSSNLIVIYDSEDIANHAEIPSSFPSGLQFTVTGGSDVSNPSLIQWLVDNNATFEGGPTPEPEVYTVPSGYYKLASLPTQGSPSVGGFTPGIEHLFETPVQLIYSSGAVKQYTYFGFVVSQFTDSNNFSVDFTVQLLDISNSVRVANLTAVDGVCTSQFYGGISNIYFSESFSIDEFSQQLILFTFALDSSYIPDEPDFPEIPYNPWAYILDMIIEALKTPLFGYFSIWDIYVTICSIFLVTWLLKLLAGG